MPGNELNKNDDAALVWIKVNCRNIIEKTRNDQDLIENLVLEITTQKTRFETSGKEEEKTKRQGEKYDEDIEALTQKKADEHALQASRYEIKKISDEITQLGNRKGELSAQMGEKARDQIQRTKALELLQSEDKREALLTSLRPKPRIQQENNAKGTIVRRRINKKGTTIPWGRLIVILLVITMGIVTTHFKLLPETRRKDKNKPGSADEKKLKWFDKATILASLEEENGTLIHLAAQRGVNAMREVFAELDTIDTIDQTNKYGETALYVAAFHQDHAVATLLLEKGANVDKPNNKGTTPIQFSAATKREKMVRILIENNANLDLLSGPGVRGTALHWAALRGDFKIVQILIQGGAKLVENDMHQTPLTLAQKEGHSEIAEHLEKTFTDELLYYYTAHGDVNGMQRQIDMGANIDTPHPENGMTPLVKASVNGDSKAVILLLNAKADPNKITDRGWTALHMATVKGNTKTVLALLQAKAEVNIPSPGLMETPLHWATERNETEISKLLISAGSNPFMPNINGISPIENAQDNTQVVDVIMAMHPDLLLGNIWFAVNINMQLRNSTSTMNHETFKEKNRIFEESYAMQKIEETSLDVKRLWNVIRHIQEAESLTGNSDNELNASPSDHSLSQPTRH